MAHAKSSKKSLDSFKTESTFTHAGKTYRYFSVKKFAGSGHGDISRMPFSLKILLENLLRNEDNLSVKKNDILKLAGWNPKKEPEDEIQFMPARVVLQDFTGVPAVADLAAMRSAIKHLGGDPNAINPLQPADLVIDHSVMVDHFGTKEAVKQNAELEFQRNGERYQFLRWGQNAFRNFRVVPPDTGIIHQVNLEYLSHVAMVNTFESGDLIYPDTMVGTDSHTTMINGLGCLGWGVGGIEAEAAMLGQPCSMLIPLVVGFKLTGKLRPGVTATDLVLTVTQMLRKKGVVGKFVEFYGAGLSGLTLADRATIANMAPEYGATVGLFPVDAKTTEFLRLTGRETQAALVEEYFKAQDLWYDPSKPEPHYSDTLELDLGTVEPSLAGPARPQDRIALGKVNDSFSKYAMELAKGDSAKAGASHAVHGTDYKLENGAVVIAAITSCTNTSNPGVLVAAGLLAKKAVEKGLTVKPWVKTSLAPGSKVVTDYLTESGLITSLDALKFNVVGYGCTTCIGNSGPLPEPISKAVSEGDLYVASVLSGNRNFEGRVNPQVKANYLASPPLVVAYAIAGSVYVDLTSESLGKDKHGKPVYLKDIWPTEAEVNAIIAKHVTSEQFKSSYAEVFKGDSAWATLKVPTGDLYAWDSKSTYIKEPPFFEGMKAKPDPVKDIHKARVLALLGDSITTDHISPAGSFNAKSAAGQYLTGLGVKPVDFNSYGARRGNHEVMVRGTFANVRLKNMLVPGIEGGVTRYLPTGDTMSIFDASTKYQTDGTPLIILAGKEYGTGSSRDWAAKGPKLLGIRAVIAESFERIHRSNLVGMGILPLQFTNGDNAKSLKLSGEETFEITGLGGLTTGQTLVVQATDETGAVKRFDVKVRIDTPNEVEYFKHGGILQYVLRSQVARV
ncbi:MAG: aconitate hydratase AcnA [Bdellovibrionales bacterium]|nr:aconitate hydratase AcnA [Bdellovibrionales bacterium]